MNGVQRVPHVKIQNYIEYVVRNYIENDFIMHFRLSREVAYQLIERFNTSDIFLSLQGIITSLMIIINDNSIILISRAWGICSADPRNPYFMLFVVYWASYCQLS